MAHTIRERTKLLQRVRRIRGQVEAIARSLEAEQECADVLQLIAAARGAMNSLMAEVLEGHIRFHVLDAKHRGRSAQAAGAQELIDVVRSYLR